jgi:hypothetical protein
MKVAFYEKHCKDLVPWSKKKFLIEQITRSGGVGDRSISRGVRGEH